MTGRFPYKSARGNQYILAVYHYDINAILAQPIKNREAATITNGWQEINKQFIYTGIKHNTCVHWGWKVTIKTSYGTPTMPYDMSYRTFLKITLYDSLIYL